MAAANYDITIEQGADYALELTIKDGTGAAINLTGATLQAHIRERWDGPKVAEFTVQVNNAAQGRAGLYMTGAASEGISPLAAFYDLLLIRATGVRQRVIQGAVNISHAITHV